mgnify:CR=1 FL=1
MQGSLRTGAGQRAIQQHGSVSGNVVPKALSARRSRRAAGLIPQAVVTTGLAKLPSTHLESSKKALEQLKMQQSGAVNREHRRGSDLVRREGRIP